MIETPAGSRLAPVTVGFGTAVAMWAVGYVCRLPHGVDDVLVPNWAVLVLLVGCLVVGGMTIGRHSKAGFLGGAIAGLICGGVNLLVFGSLIVGEEANEVLPSAAIWVPGFIAALAVIMGVAALLQSRVPGPQWSPTAWRTAFGASAVGATLMAVIAGGIVTSQEAGLAVPDWPNSFGSNMFLYPLSKMTGGIYYEHAHRLYGALVGLTAIALVLVSLFGGGKSTRPWSITVLIMIIIQGIMGGLRVTEAAPDPSAPEVTASLLSGDAAIAVVHGVFGQLVFAMMCLTFASTTGKWIVDRKAQVEGSAGDRTLTTMLLIALVAQLALGALYRHSFTEEKPLPWPAHAHLTMAAVVLVLGCIVGLRTWARYDAVPLIKRHGMIITILIGLQVMLGVAALVTVLMQEGEPGTTMTIMTVAHQANGALLLGVTALQVAWVRRLVAPA